MIKIFSIISSSQNKFFTHTHTHTHTNAHTGMQIKNKCTSHPKWTHTGTQSHSNKHTHNTTCNRCSLQVLHGGRGPHRPLLLLPNRQRPHLHQGGGGSGGHGEERRGLSGHILLLAAVIACPVLVTEASVVWGTHLRKKWEMEMGLPLTELTQ